MAVSQAIELVSFRRPKRYGSEWISI